MKKQNTSITRSLFFMWRTSFTLTDLVVAQPLGNLHHRELKELSDTLIQICKEIPRTPSIVTLGACSNNLIPSATHGGEHVIVWNSSAASILPQIRGLYKEEGSAYPWHLSSSSFDKTIILETNILSVHLYHCLYFVLRQKVCIFLFFLHVQLCLFSLDLPPGSLFLFFGLCESVGNFSN